MSSTSAETSREQRRKDREERKRARNGHDSVIKNGSVKREKTPRKQKISSDLSAGLSVHKKPPSGSKYGQQSFDRVKIIEKTPSIEIPEKENKEKTAAENSEKSSSSNRKRLGNKFLDNLSKFESNTKKNDEEKKEKNAFLRSYRSQNQDSAGAPFRRSYRPPRSSSAVEDPSLLTRRSLRKERVAESIAKLEQNKTKLKLPPSPSSSRKRTVESPYAAKSTSVSSRPSSAGSTKTFSDSGSSTSSSRRMSRAEQAIERHKDRMRKSSRSALNGSMTSPESPGVSKLRTSSSDSLPKTPKQKQSKEKTSSKTGEKSRKISITKSPLEGGDVEITMVTELTTPTKEKMNVVIKERASSVEDVFEITGEVIEPEHKPDEPRPISVSDAVALFSGDDKSPTKDNLSQTSEKPKRTRRKLPDIATVESKQKKIQGAARERRRQNRHSKAVNKHSDEPEDGSGEPRMRSIAEQNVVVMEMSQVFGQAKENVVVTETSPSFQRGASKKRKSKKFASAKLAPSFSQPSTLKEQRQYDATEAIDVLRRLSEEVSSPDATVQSPGMDVRSFTARLSLDEILIIEEDEATEDTTNEAFSIANTLEEISTAANKRPTTLEIDEILCVAPTPQTANKEFSQALVTSDRASPVKSPLKSSVKQSSVEEKVQFLFSPSKEALVEQEVPEIQSFTIVQQQQSLTEGKEMAGRKNLIRKTTIPWLDDWSDDDDVSSLSDASTLSDLEIDYEWLGKTDSDDDDYIPKSINIRSKLRKFSSPKIIAQSTPEPKKSAKIERVTSKAADMLALWEKKAAEPTNSPSRSGRNITTDIRVGSVKAAWSDQDKKTKIKSVHEEEDGSAINGTGKSDEMKDLFDSKISGKIQGAKAMFETLAQTSPVLPRSPSVNRSPVIRKQERKPSIQSSDNSPRLSRQSSVADNISQENGHDDSTDSPARSPDNFQNIENVRAMFENDMISQKQTPKHKMSLADIVSEGNDDCDITDVRSVKAMWESMDNHSYEKSPKKLKKKSNIQKKVAAKSEKRRSMTQPVTTLDVMEAQSMMKDDDSSKNCDEVGVKFQDRLKFFSQLSSDKLDEKIEIRQRTRSASHRLEAEEDSNKRKSKFANQAPEYKKAEKMNLQKKEKVSVIPSGSSDNESLLSSSSTSIDEPDSKTKKYISSSEEEMSAIAEIKATGSVHDRLKLLQRKETEEKNKRNAKVATGLTSSLSERLNKLKSNEDKWKTPNSNSKTVNRVESLSNRIAKIKEDSETWKERKGKQNDAAQFTTQAKIAKKEGAMAISVLPSPLLKRRVLPAVLPNHSVTEKETNSISDSTSMNQLSFVEKLANKGLEENVLKKTEVRTTEVPTIDEEEFEKFFGINPEVVMNGDDRSSLIIEELPEIKSTVVLSDVGRLKSNVQKASKRKPSSRNPVKALAARDDIKLSYDEERSNITKLEQQRIAQRGYGANFTSAALAGLAAKADLSKVKLRSSKNTPMPSSDDLKPFKDVMLLRVKGRRQIQTRLVEPRPKSLCTDDAFLLVTPKKLYGWFGDLCNVIERAKVNEIADYIIRKGDLGCKVSSLISIEEIANQARYKEFWNVLGGSGEWDKVTSPGADEQFEIDAAATIKTYKMIDSKLIPHEESWGKLPKMGMLGSSDTYVFDFGAEMYIWQGKEVSFANRRLAVRLSRVIWDQGYDYTEFGVCPFFSSELKGKRPEFGLFARVNENLETSLFQEKFEDWSNIYREIGEDEAEMRETNRGKAIDENTMKSEILNEAEPCDVKKMIENVAKSANMIVDGFDISGGDGEILDEDGRILKILTEKVEAFHVTESSVEPFDDSVLHRSNSYVVQWKYTISSTGRFENSKTATSKSDSSNGRSRVAYFAWAGVNSIINDKGTSALIAANMDTGDGTLKIIDEATAPPVFSKSFQGNLLIVDGKRGERKGAYEWKLFKICGDTEKSASLVQVRCSYKSLRSSSSFVFLLPRDSTTVIWHGCRSPEHVREITEEAVDKLNDRMPGSIPFRKNRTSLNITICEEGKENEHFKEAVGSKRRGYECLLDAVDLKHRTTRAWQFVIQSGSVVAVELCPVHRNSLFPLVQEQLYEAEQPSLILIDSMFGAFLWQNCSQDELAGSAKRRWDVIRRLALETTLVYCKENKLNEAKLIEAGHEPSTLTNAFPSWTVDETKRSSNLLVQKSCDVSKVLSTLSRLTYTLDELRGDVLPDGVDPCHLETYLTNSDFEKLFGITKSEFYQFPPWKQTQLRKKKKLF